MRYAPLSLQIFGEIVTYAIMRHKSIPYSGQCWCLAKRQTQVRLNSYFLKAEMNKSLKQNNRFNSIKFKRTLSFIYYLLIYNSLNIYS